MKARTITDIQNVYIIEKDFNYYFDKIRYNRGWKVIVLFCIIGILIATYNILYNYGFIGF